MAKLIGTTKGFLSRVEKWRKGNIYSDPPEGFECTECTDRLLPECPARQDRSVFHREIGRKGGLSKKRDRLGLQVPIAGLQETAQDHGAFDHVSPAEASAGAVRAFRRGNDLRSEWSGQAGTRSGDIHSQSGGLRILRWIKRPTGAQASANGARRRFW